MKKQLLALSLLMMSIGLFSQSTIWKPFNANLDTSWGPRWLSVVDTNTVWEVGYNGSVPTATSNKFTRTQNSGTFIPGTFLPDTFSFASSNISAVNDSVAYIPCYFIAGTGRSGIVRKTMDRGVTWTTCTDTTTMFTGTANFPDWAHFYTNNRGIVLGDPNGGNFEIYHTYNGGTSWTRVPNTSITPTPPSGEYGLTDCVTWYGSKHLWYGTGHSSNGTPHVYRSNDTGHTWQAAAAGVPGMLGGVNGLAFRDSLNGLCWGFTATTSGKFLLKRTHDGGITWTTVYQHDKVGTADVCVIPGRNAFMSVGLDSTSAVSVAAGTGVVGNGILTSVTYDDGLTWNILESAPGGPAANAYYMLKVQMLDSAHGWAGCFADNTLPFGNNGMDKWMGPVIPLSCPMYVTGNTTACSSATTTLTANGATSYTWAPNSANTAAVAVTPTTTTVYSVTGTSGNCTNTVNYTLTVSPNPTVSVTSSVTNDTICNLNSTMLTATGGTTYSWAPNSSLSSGAGPSVTASPSVTTTYTITGTTGSCQGKDTIRVVVLACAGINQLSVNGTQVSFYPNPSFGQVTATLSNVKAGTVINVSDLLGNEVYKTTINTGSMNQNLNIDLSTLPKGVYLFGVSNGTQSRVQKLVIQ